MTAYVRNLALRAYAAPLAEALRCPKDPSSFFSCLHRLLLISCLLLLLHDLRVSIMGKSLEIVTERLILCFHLFSVHSPFTTLEDNLEEI
jgi:hypothetical protein